MEEDENDVYDHHLTKSKDQIPKTTDNPSSTED
jgi:hypothetical protein